MLTIAPVKDFLALAGEWDELLADSDAASLFATREWLFTWWARLRDGAQPAVLVVREGERLIAVAPFHRRRAGLDRQPAFSCLDLIGGGEVGSDYLDVIVRRGHEPAALALLAGRMAGFDHAIALRRLRASATVTRLADLLVARGACLVERPEETARYIPLAGQSFEAYLGTLGSSHRYAFRRRLRELERDFEVELEVVTTEERRPAAFAALVALHRARWGERSEAFARPELVAFHDEVSRLAVARGWLRLFILKLDGQPAAALHAFRYRDVFYHVQSGFATEHAARSVGLVVVGMAIRAACAEGAAEFDLGHGDDGYKHHWARAERPLRRLEVYPPGARGWIYRQTASLDRGARQLGRRVFDATRAQWAARTSVGRLAAPPPPPGPA